MGIQKQQFYEGAALHQLVRGDTKATFRRMAPFFILNERVQLHIKYSTGKRSPWGFTFTPDEQKTLHVRAAEMPLMIGLVCGSDGVVALPYEDYTKIAMERSSAIRVSCFRRHRKHYEVWGPDGSAARKIPPSDWRADKF